MTFIYKVRPVGIINPYSFYKVDILSYKRKGKHKNFCASSNSHASLKTRKKKGKLINTYVIHLFFHSSNLIFILIFK